MKIRLSIMLIFVFLFFPIFSSVAAKQQYFIDENYIYHYKNKSINLLENIQTIPYLALGIDNKNLNYLDGTNNELALRLSGRILLAVENNGQLLYLNPSDLKLYNLNLKDLKYSLNKILGKQEIKLKEFSELNENTKVIHNEKEDQSNFNLDPRVEKLLALVNAEREKYNLKKYVYDEELSKIALDKAKDMYENKYFAHISNTGLTPGQRLNKFSYTHWRKMGENLAVNYNSAELTAEKSFNLWMNSAGHRANILNPDFEKIGIAFYQNYAVQEFVLQ